MAKMYVAPAADMIRKEPYAMNQRPRSTCAANDNPAAAVAMTDDCLLPVCEQSVCSTFWTAVVVIGSKLCGEMHAATCTQIVQCILFFFFLVLPELAFGIRIPVSWKVNRKIRLNFRPRSWHQILLVTIITLNVGVQLISLSWSYAHLRFDWLAS